MGRMVLCAATPWAGVRHRYLMLRQVKAYADRYGYSVRMLWPLSGAVANHRHEELFAPVPGVEIHNISRDRLRTIRELGQRDGGFNYNGEAFRMRNVGEGQGERFFSWDLEGSGDLALLVPRPFPKLLATPIGPIRAETAAYVKANRVHERLGIRVRAIEVPKQKNRIHRVKSELDGVLHSLYRIPWYLPVFIVTDSEYIQQRLASHFADSVFFPKKFDEVESSGRYVHRNDKDAMKTFIKEIGCLCACKKIISYGGFLNDTSVEEKIIKEPYEEAAYMNVATA